MMGLSIGEQKNYLLPVLYLEPFYRNHLRGQTIEETMREIASCLLYTSSDILDLMEILILVLQSEQLYLKMEKDMYRQELESSTTPFQKKNLWRQRLKPVSYTHLDVYKRQEFAICVNMAVPYYTGLSLPFVASIVIGTIQLGATVDYAILMTSRYQKERMNGKKKMEAIRIAHETSMQSIITSGLSFFAATIGIAIYSNIDMISAICTLLARGADVYKRQG